MQAVPSAQQFLQLRFGRLRKQRGQMCKDALTGFLRRMCVHVGGEICTEMLLRHGVAGNTPTVGRAVFVPPVFKIRSGHIALHLQKGQDGIKPFASVFAKSAQLLEFGGEQRPVRLQQIVDVLVTQ